MLLLSLALLAAPPQDVFADRVRRLETRVAVLEAEIAELKKAKEAPAAKPVADFIIDPPTPSPVQPQAYSACSNGQCGVQSYQPVRRGLFGFRRR